LAVALIQTPHRFRSKRQLWAYSGLALETRSSADYRYVEGQLRRSKKLISIRGLNKDHNHGGRSFEQTFQIIFKRFMTPEHTEDSA